jgi:hypothetical protein
MFNFEDSTHFLNAETPYFSDPFDPFSYEINSVPNTPIPVYSPFPEQPNPIEQPPPTPVFRTVGSITADVSHSSTFLTKHRSRMTIPLWLLLFQDNPSN